MGALNSRGSNAYRFNFTSRVIAACSTPHKPPLDSNWEAGVREGEGGIPEWQPPASESQQGITYENLLAWHDPIWDEQQQVTGSCNIKYIADDLLSARCRHGDQVQLDWEKPNMTLATCNSPIYCILPLEKLFSLCRGEQSCKRLLRFISHRYMQDSVIQAGALWNFSMRTTLAGAPNLTIGRSSLSILDQSSELLWY